MSQLKAKICVIGGGRWGKNHIATLSRLNALAAIVDPSEALRSHYRELYPSVEIYSTIEEINPGQFDGVVIATPARLHYEHAKQMLIHGYPVLVEKPIALKAHEAAELVSLARAKRLRLSVGHLLLFHPAIQKIKEIITSGRLGTLRYLYSNRLNFGTIRADENILWSFAPHDIAVFQYLINEYPTQIESRGEAFIQPHIHDTTVTLLRYPNKIAAHIYVSWLHPFKEHRLVVIGSEGMISFDDASVGKELKLYKSDIAIQNGVPTVTNGSYEVVSYQQLSPLEEELKFFIENIGLEDNGSCSSERAHEVLRILEEATASALNVPWSKATMNSNQAQYYVHPSSVIDDSVTIGEGTKIWHFSHIQSGAVIGARCVIGQNVNVANNVSVGDNCKIQNNTSLYEGVTLEDNVFCGPSVVFTNVKRPRAKYPQRGADFYSKTLVRSGCSIGANATIVCGVTLGKNSFIGAGAVVSKNVPDHALVVGNPGKIVGWVCDCGRTLPECETQVSCQYCNKRYVLSEDGALREIF
jgi:UDP-2-acetamido-3-amino-2,3-dideoxy-glucuronate N-acetyltransferase